MNKDYETVEERDCYLSQGKQLALEVGAPESEVLSAFETEVRSMLVAARIKDFVPVLAAKRVRERFRARPG